MVTLVVGEKEEAIFTIPQNLLCKASSVFEANCKPEWLKPDRVISPRMMSKFKKKKKNHIDSADLSTLVDAVIIQYADMYFSRTAIKGMVYWMINDKICLPKETYYSPYRMESTEEEAMESVWGFLAKLYILGDKYFIPRLRNDVIDGLIVLYRNHTVPPVGIASYIYKNTSSEESLFGRLLARMVLWSLDGDHWRRARDSGIICHEFLFDVVVEVGQEGGCPCSLDTEIHIPNPESVFCEEFHEHDADYEGKCGEPKEYCVEEEDDDDDDDDDEEEEELSS
jgi:hypothetical protein